ncbi:MAG: FAD-dependent oxidoreductase, partial [Acidimicrobiales bacterium]
MTLLTTAGTTTDETTTTGETSGGARPRVTVLVDRCAGCQECVIRCPTGALGMNTRRWVAEAEDALCVGCRQCVRTCPFSAITVDGPMLVAERVEVQTVHPEHLVGDVGEIRRGLSSWEEATEEAARCLACPDPTCVRGCPAHNDIPSFIRAVSERNLGKAHEVLRRTSVLPDTCSRVCNQSAQCEGACTWSLAGGTPVAIGRLERFICDNAPVPPPVVPSAAAPTAASELSVAIVGAGPAAIGAAWELVEAGASVTVYEKDPHPGGLLGWGIPDFTLPEAVAARPWGQLTGAGVTLECNTEVGPEDLDRLLSGNDAVLLAHGASLPLRLPVPGADLRGVTDATTVLQAGKEVLERGGTQTDFLAALGIAPAGPGSGPNPRVLVLGAGNTAMDVARTVRRLGMPAVCVDWLDERFALVRPDELAESRTEGVDVRFSRTLTELRGEDGWVRHAELAHTRQRSSDERPKVLHEEPDVIAVDLVVMAMGYRADPAFSEAIPGAPLRREANGLPDRRWMASGILANPASAAAFSNPVGRLALGREVGLWASTLPFRDRLWAAGDALVGPSTVVESMSQGRRAARAIMAADPRGPGRTQRRGPRRILVAYESRSGHTRHAAEVVAAALSNRGAEVGVRPVA